MTTMPPEPPPQPAPVQPAAVRELIGLALLLLGVSLVITAAFLVSPKLGIAVLGVVASAAGAWLTFGEA